MIERLEISGVHTEINDKLKKYAINKIGRLDRYMAKHTRESAHVEIILKESKTKTKKDCICEVVMHLPKENITTKEATLNMFAAIDIVEAKLKNQLKKYKETHTNPRLHQRIAARFKRVQPAE